MANKGYKIGGYATDTEPAEIIMLHTYVATSGRVSGLVKSGTTGNYQVTAGKTFVATKIIMANGDAANVAAHYALGYNDDPIGLDVTTARTNPVATLGFPEATTFATLGGLVKNGAQANSSSDQNASLDDISLVLAPASKYIYLKMIASTTINDTHNLIIFGYEK